jgi:hypothetical protein
LVVDAEMHLALQSVVNRLLAECDDIGAGLSGFQQSVHVVRRNVVVIVHEREVLPASDVHKRLPFCADASGAIVEKHKMLNRGASNLL